MSSEVIKVEEIAPNTIGSSLGVTHQPPVAEIVMVEGLKVKEESDHQLGSAASTVDIPNSVGTSVTSTDVDDQVVVVEVKGEKVSSSTPQLAPASSDTERPVDRDEAALAIAALANTFSNHSAKPATQQTSVAAAAAASVPSSATTSSADVQSSGVTTVRNVSEIGARSGSENRTASPVPETQSAQPNLSPSFAPHAATGPLQQALDAASHASMNMHPKQQQGMSENIYGAMTGQGVVGGGGGTSVSDLMMLAYAQQQQQQQQQQQAAHPGMVGMGGMGGMGGIGDIGWTPEEQMAINRAQESLHQSAMQFAQATYATRMQAGSNELLAKEEARLVFQEYMQKGQQSLQLQLQTLYQQKVQAVMQQQRALEAMRLQQQATLAASRAGPLMNGAGIAGQANVGIAGNSVSTMMSKLGAQGGVVTGHQTTASAAFSILCQAADERPDGSQVPPAQKNSPKHAVEVVERSFGNASSSTEKHSKEDQESRIWRENLVGKTIEVEYDGEWYPAKVLMRNLDVFVVLYDEDDTEERMRLFPDFTAQDPEGDDDFRWRMKASSSSAAKKSASSASKSVASSASSSVKKKKNGDGETSESREDRKSQDGNSESSLKESIREGREKRAELRALANARRLEEEALANAKKQEADAVSIRKKAEDEYRTKKEKLEDERRALEADRKKLEEERASVEKLHEDAVKVHKQNESILKQIREEKQALAKLKKELQKSKSGEEEQEEEVQVEEEEEEDKRETAENEEDESSKNSKAGQRRKANHHHNVEEEDDQSSSAKGEDQEEDEEEDDDEPAPQHDDEQEEEDAEVEEEEDEEEESEEPPAKRMKPGRKPNGQQKRTSTGSKRSIQSGRRSSSGSQKLVSASENEGGDENDEHEEENEEESAQASEQDDHDEVSGGESTSSGKKRGRPSKKEPPSVMRWSTRKTVPVKRFEAGLKGKWASGRTPRALGFIAKGKFGFVPPSGVKALQFRVRVWWKDDKRFYEGTVDAFRNGKHKILYDDEDVEWLVLENETIEWFIPEGAEFAPLHIDPNLAFA